MISRRRLLELAALALAPARVVAHAVLADAVPAPGARLGRPPGRVRLRFSERLEPAFARLAVHDATGRRIDRGDTAVVPGDRRGLAVSLPPLGPGQYTVRYRVLSVDGHVVEAAYTFSIDPPR